MIWYVEAAIIAGNGGYDILRKKISSRIIGTNSFVERKVRSTGGVNKSRRAEDVQHKNALSRI